MFINHDKNYTQKELNTAANRMAFEFIWLIIIVPIFFSTIVNKPIWGYLIKNSDIHKIDEQIKEFYLAINSVNLESDAISKYYSFMYLEIIAFIIVILLFSRSIYFFIRKKINVIVLKFSLNYQHINKNKIIKYVSVFIFILIIMFPIIYSNYYSSLLTDNNIEVSSIKLFLFIVFYGKLIQIFVDLFSILYLHKH